MIKIVLDTNILVAAARSRQGASFVIVSAIQSRAFEFLVSVPLFLEYEAVLKRPEQLQASGRSVATVDAFLDALCLYSTPVHLHYLWRPQTRDAADEMVLETALNGGARVLLTLNTADFDQAASRFGLALMTPGQFCQQHLGVS